MAIGDMERSLLRLEERVVRYQLGFGIDRGPIDIISARLLRLVTEGVHRPADLAQQLSLGRPSVSKRLASLKRMGLVSMEEDRTDGRARRVVLTELGASTLESHFSLHHASFERVFANWTREQRDEAARVLEAIVQSAEVAESERLGLSKPEEATPLRDLRVAK